MSVMSFLGEGGVFGMPATVSPVVLLPQSWVSTVGTMIRLSNTSMDSGMVLLEQTWVMVFLLGDNLEDLEM